MNMKRRLTIAAVTITAAAALAGCATTPANGTACKLYADAYNQMMDVAKLKNNNVGTVTAADVVEQEHMLPIRIQDAFGKASGTVAVDIRDSADAATQWVSDGSSDSGVAFFMTSRTVATACKSDGAAISLHQGQ